MNYEYGPGEKNLAQITASDVCRILVYAADSVTPTNPKTSIAFGSVTVTTRKAGATTFSAWPVSPGWGTGNWQEIGNGWYWVIITGSVATELALLDTEGPFLLHLSASGAIFPEVCRHVVASGVARESSLVTVDLVVDAIKVVTDKVATMLAVSGVNWQFTADALENGPVDGQSYDWTANERTAIKAILGIAADNATPQDPTAGILDIIRDSIPTVAEIDTQLSSTHGSGAWGGSAGSGSSAVTVTVKDDNDVLLEGVAVTIKNQAETAIIAGPLYTDENGEAVFYCTDAQQLRAIPTSAPGLSGGATDFTVSGTTAVTCIMTNIVISAPADPTVCRVYGWLLNADGTANEGAAVEYRVENPPATTTTGQTITGADQWQAVATDVNGLFQIDLVRSSVIDDKLWRIRSKQDGYNEIVYVPDATTALRSTLTSAIPE